MSTATLFPARVILNSIAGRHPRPIGLQQPNNVVYFVGEDIDTPLEQAVQATFKTPITEIGVANNPLACESLWKALGRQDRPPTALISKFPFNLIQADFLLGLARRMGDTTCHHLVHIYRLGRKAKAVRHDIYTHDFITALRHIREELPRVQHLKLHEVGVDMRDSMRAAQSICSLVESVTGRP